MARNFDGVDQFINFPNLDSFLSGSTTYSGAIRFRSPTATPSTPNTMLSFRATTALSPIFWLLGVSTGGFPTVNIRGNSGPLLTVTGTNQISANTWHSLMFTRAGNDVLMYLDDFASETQTPVTLITNTTASLLDVGCTTEGTSSTRENFTEGDLAEAAVWDVTLTDDEVASYMGGMNPLLIRPANLIFYAPVWGTTLEPDLSGRGGIGTLNGTPDPPPSGFHSPTGEFVHHAHFNQATALKRKEIEHIYRENLAAETQSSTTWRTILSVRKGAIPPRSRWWIMVKGAVSTTSATNLTGVRLLINGVEELGSFSNQEHKTANFADGLDYMFSKVLDFDESPGDIELQIRNSASSTTQMDSSNIFMLRLDKDFKENVDYWYTQSTAIIAPTTSFANDTARINKIPHPVDLLGSGEVFMAIGCTAHEATAVLDNARKLQMQLKGGDVDVIRNIINRDAAEEQVTVLGAVATALTAAGFLAENQIAVNNSGTENLHKFSSLFVIRKSVFNQSIFTNSPDVINSTTAETQHEDLTLTPNFAGNFFGLALGRVSFEAGSTAGLRNGEMYFKNGGTVVPLGDDSVFGCDSENIAEDNPVVASAYFKDLPASSQSIELMTQGNEANQVEFEQVAIFLFSLLPSRHFRVSGIIQEAGVNVSRTVRAFLSSTGELVGESVSDPDTGAYEICNLPGGKVSVVAYDNAGGDSFNAQIFDKVVPVNP